MKIGGLQKITLLDFPEHIACTVFLKGCNFRCPFCYNSPLLNENENGENLTEDDFFSFLKSRKNKLDGVAITGGEPLLQKDIIDFIIKIKNLGFKVKLDTNGSYPKVLKELIARHLVDYVAMDLKNSLDKYELTTNHQVNIANIVESINILMSGAVEYEFRTTVVEEYHTLEDFEKMGQLVANAKRYYLQCYQYQDSVLDKSLHALSKEKLQECLKVLQKYVANAQLRGID